MSDWRNGSGTMVAASALGTRAAVGIGSWDLGFGEFGIPGFRVQESALRVFGFGAVGVARHAGFARVARFQNPLIKEYTLSYNRNPNSI